MWPDDWGLHMTTQKSDGQRYRAAVREAWDEGRGTLVVPAGFELSRLDADRGVLTAEIIDAAGTRFGARVSLSSTRHARRERAGWRDHAGTLGAVDVPRAPHGRTGDGRRGPDLARHGRCEVDHDGEVRGVIEGRM